MIVARLGKVPTQIRRCTLDFSLWLDPGETLTGFTPPVITLAATGWAGPSPFVTALDQAPLPFDPTPLALLAAAMTPDATAIQLMFDAGSIGGLYEITSTAAGQSGRTRPFTVLLAVQES